MVVYRQSERETLRCWKQKQLARAKTLSACKGDSIEEIAKVLLALFTFLFFTLLPGHGAFPSPSLAPLPPDAASLFFFYPARELMGGRARKKSSASSRTWRICSSTAANLDWRRRRWRGGRNTWVGGPFLLCSIPTRKASPQILERKSREKNGERGE